jgi:hypothetical protein
MIQSAIRIGRINTPKRNTHPEQERKLHTTKLYLVTRHVLIIIIIIISRFVA